MSDEYDEKVSNQKNVEKINYNRKAKDLPRLFLGEEVRVQDPATKKWNRLGNIVGIGKFRDYSVKLPSGRLLRRNRKFLLKIPPCPELKDDHANTETATSPRRSSRMKKPTRQFQP